MATKQKVLICGSSIVGPALAFWLDKAVYDIVMIEKEDRFPTGGQNIDIKGPGLKVIEMMHLRKQIEAQFTGERGIVFVNTTGKVEARFPKDAETSFTSEIEILRGDLAKTFFDASKEGIDYRAGTYVTALTQHKDNVEITFNDETTETFDLVFACDGIGSDTRTQIFGKQNVLNYLGIYTAYFTIPRTEEDSDWAVWYNGKGGKVVFLRPDNKGTIKACVNFLSNELLDKQLSVEEKKNIVRSVLTGAGWQCDRIARGLDESNDVYFGPISQVKMPVWSKGRCVLVGDAAHAPSPLTGKGTTLAIIGAYILAGELREHADYAHAFAAYEAKFRPFVTQTQKLAPGVPRIAYPKTALGIWIFNKCVGIVASKPVQRAIGLFAKDKPQEETFELPHYPMSQ